MSNVPTLTPSSVAINTPKLAKPLYSLRSPCNITYPFTALKTGTWLHNRPEKDTFELLIDIYRLRMEDQYKHDGASAGGLWGGESPADALKSLRRFLRKIGKYDMAREIKLLPPWWSKDKIEACLNFALTDRWSDIGRAVKKSEIIEHYDSLLMPMQMRIFGEKADGTLMAGLSGEGMLDYHVMDEQGCMDVVAVSMLGIAH